MLPAAARVRRSEDFSAVLRAGRRVGRGPLVVHLHNSAAGAPVPSRAGFVVGRGVGNAVMRNRTLRRLRHLARTRLATLPSGSTLVVRALPGAADATYDELGAHLDSALRRLSASRVPV